MTIIDPELDDSNGSMHVSCRVDRPNLSLKRNKLIDGRLLTNSLPLYHQDQPAMPETNCWENCWGPNADMPRKP